ncbi:hypothetical protein GCM10022631_09730 [Deinococcus rubellus]|uniref:hypothetical protein n=1 Tax=Deinococcus rubellus TaxID=1889240 RepID=UPI0031EBF9F6
MPQIVSGRYETHDNALQAVWALHAAGLPLGDIALVSLSMQPTPTPLRRDSEPFDVPAWWVGFLEALLSRHLDPETLRAYMDVINSGAYLMLAHGTAERASTVRQVLKESGARDIEMRVSTDVDCSGTPAPFPVPIFPPASGPERWCA